MKKLFALSIVLLAVQAAKAEVEIVAGDNPGEIKIIETVVKENCINKEKYLEDLKQEKLGYETLKQMAVNHYDAKIAEVQAKIDVATAVEVVAPE